MDHAPSEVAVALSGGVDSSMGAYLLQESGWKVTGVHFVLPSVSSEQEDRLAQAETVAKFLNIPLHIVDLREAFTRLIITPFVQDYLRGLTPNPCISCNPLIKFAALHDFIRIRRISCLATGHYARLRSGADPVRTGLFRGRDPQKDQTYFLHRLDQTVLSKAVFPLGEFTKGEVLAQAKNLGLPSCKSRESQEICFLGSLDYRVFLEEHAAEKMDRTGRIVTTEGKTVGEHAGIHRFTIGQRHGLGIASSRPYYVKEIRPFENIIVVGRREDLYTKTVHAELFHWLAPPPHENCIEVAAQIRYRHKLASGFLERVTPSRVRVTFHEPQWAVTPGQSLVCCLGDQVLGGGVIING